MPRPDWSPGTVATNEIVYWVPGCAGNVTSRAGERTMLASLPLADDSVITFQSGASLPGRLVPPSSTTVMSIRPSECAERAFALIPNEPSYSIHGRTSIVPCFVGSRTIDTPADA